MSVRTMAIWKNNKLLVGSATGLHEFSDFEATSVSDICVSAASTSNVLSPELESVGAYPNPVKDVLNLDCSCSYQLYDTQGSLVNSGHGNFVDMSALSAGTYLLVFNGKNIQVVKD